MKVLIVYAHPNPKSLNHAILETLKKELTQSGHDPDVVDLYAMRFNPVLSGEELAGLMEGKIAKEIQDHQEKVSCADALVLIHPIWWTGAPAVLKGWIDRVLTLGFAYTFDQKLGTLIGLLKNRKVLIINTAGAAEKDGLASGMTEAVRKIEAEMVFQHCGIQDVKHVVFYNVPRSDEATRKGYLEKVRQLAKTL
jgi:NAD(P)H dehydrogenase (quinone)